MTIVRFVRSVALAAAILVPTVISSSELAVHAVTGPGSTCTPSGNKGCLAQVLPGGSFEIRDWTWTGSDTAGVALLGCCFNFTGDRYQDFTLWRNRLATGSRALYITDSIVGGTPCWRLKFDSRTWVSAPTGHSNFTQLHANTAGAGVYGSCLNA
jgi:hypothetical protein